jgi:UDP-N-acetylglucosamine diphosphorylase/glucosamine-1-phosphate N-acetyltransferase
MTQSLCIVEARGLEYLFPLSYVRPVFDLRCGITRLRAKVERSYPGLAVTIRCRPYLADAVREQNPTVAVNAPDAAGCLYVNGQVLAGPDLIAAIPPDGEDAVFVSGGLFLAARVGSKHRAALPDVFDAGMFPDLPRREVRIPLMRYPWDLVNNNGEQIVADVHAMGIAGQGKILGKVYDGVHLLAKENITIEEGAIVKPGVVLDAESGPIVIGKNARIYPHATIEGPAYIGPGSLIKIGAKIYEDTSIGEMCKVGGEVEASIVHSHSNKQHDGFLGHAYLGMWVNLGADTNNSDLKNNYANVKVTINHEVIDTGSMFAGLIMGDHAKSGINTMFNTGTVVGVSCNVYGAGFPPKYIPSFAWGGGEGLVAYDLEKSIAVARRVMVRRKETLTAAAETVLRTVYALTQDDRRASGLPT